jgi:hypothetical protein
MEFEYRFRDSTLLRHHRIYDIYLRWCFCGQGTIDGSEVLRKDEIFLVVLVRIAVRRLGYEK